MYGLEEILLPEVVKIFSQIFLRMHNQIIHNFKHVHVDYNPLKGMLVLILSLKLSTVPYAAGAESRGHSKTVWLYIDVNCFPSFIVRWILNFVDQPTHENPEMNV